MLGPIGLGLLLIVVGIIVAIVPGIGIVGILLVIVGILLVIGAIAAGRRRGQAAPPA